MYEVIFILGIQIIVSTKKSVGILSRYILERAKCVSLCSVIGDRAIVNIACIKSEFAPYGLLYNSPNTMYT